MKKIFFMTLTIFLFSSSLKADYLMGHLEKCAVEYYYSYDSVNNRYLLTFLNSHTGNWNITTTNVGFISSGYVYDVNTGRCQLNTITHELGIQYHDYKFLMGLMGLLIGFSWLFSFLHIFSRR